MNLDAAPNVEQAVPSFVVSNMDASVRFYETLGFVMTNKWIHEGELRWCWLAHGKAGVMLQGSRKTTEEWASRGKAGTGVTVCFICHDALALYHAFIEHGISAAPPFVSNGMWMTSLADPDGYRLEFESQTDVPEGTEL